MSRGGMGYEISFAYNNFDNATMYPLILLILLVSIIVNMRAGALGEAADAPAGAAMNGAGKAVLANALRLIVGHPGGAGSCCTGSVGDVAMRSPLADHCRFTVQAGLDRTVLDASRRNSRRPSRGALLIAVVIGLSIGFLLGLHRLRQQVLEPMLVALYSIPKITLYPILLLDVRPRHVGQDRVRRHPRHHPDRAVHHQRACATSARSCSRPRALMGLGPLATVRAILLPAALPEIFTGFRIGFSLTLIGTLLGEMFASQRGLGYLLMNAIGLHNVDLIMALTFMLVVFAADREQHPARHRPAAASSVELTGGRGRHLRHLEWRPCPRRH